MKKILITSVAALALTTGVAFAQTPAANGASGDTSFAAADTDASGGVSLAEAQFIWPELTQETFDASDADSDGSLNETEYAALVTAAAPTDPSVVEAPDDTSQSPTEPTDDTTDTSNPATPPATN